ncbi:MAG: hypothetical protein EOM66_00010 [Clostridia bacterium]|nr:Rid family detoxifying hydrolase [Candidatus Pelethousia sp.]NCB29772.1 hypothetical protein [Clostridia bacterium]
MKQSIISPNAPKALGPYCHATVSGKLVFVSGTVGVDPATGKMAESVEEQAGQVMTNIATILAEAGTTLQHALKATIFLTDLGNFAAVNKIYGDAFEGIYPARSCFEVNKLPGGASVEIELIAELP